MGEGAVLIGGHQAGPQEHSRRQELQHWPEDHAVGALGDR